MPSLKFCVSKVSERQYIWQICSDMYPMMSLSKHTKNMMTGIAGIIPILISSIPYSHILKSINQNSMNHFDGIEIIEVDQGFNISHDVMYELSRHIPNYPWNNLAVTKELWERNILKKDHIEHSTVDMVNVCVPDCQSKDIFLLQLNEYIAETITHYHENTAIL